MFDEIDGLSAAAQAAASNGSARPDGETAGSASDRIAVGARG
jgi:hypothetical protein